jgi:hypothetical protein
MLPPGKSTKVLCKCRSLSRISANQPTSWCGGGGGVEQLQLSEIRTIISRCNSVDAVVL